MSVSLEYQSVYCRREEIVRPMTLTIIACLVLLAVLSFKIWIKLQIIDVGYDLAKAKQYSTWLDEQRRELELHKSVLLRPDNLIRSVTPKGFQYMKPEQAVVVNFVDG
jgi:hypothetical protein